MQTVEDLGKVKSRYKQTVSVEEDDLAGFEDVSSDGEDDNYGAAFIRRPCRKRVCADGSGKHHLMEGEGRNLRVMGFNRRERVSFRQILMRFGASKHGWEEFSKRLTRKSCDEIKDYGILYLKHLYEDLNDSPTFSDGVPKEGVNILDVLVRLGTLTSIRDKVEALAEGSILFADDVLSRFPGLNGGRIWKDPHDRLLLQAIMKHGYERWQEILDDKDINLEEVICQELNLDVTDNSNAAAPALINKEILVEFIKKRVRLLEMGLLGELQKEYYAEMEEMNDVHV